MMLPHCAKCKRMVDGVSRRYDPIACCSIYSVYCHGEVEETSLSDFTLEEAQSIDYAVAFKPKEQNGIARDSDLRLASGGDE